jgi:hypothetical protein
MPVIRRSHTPNPFPELRGRLAELLAKELIGERVRDGPVIFEVSTGRNDEIDVIVIWEAWSSLPSDDRTTIIRDVIQKAYDKHRREIERAIHYIDPDRKPSEPIVPRVSLAVGATLDEAIAQGLLPYSVRATAQVPGADPYATRQLMIESGGIETASGVELRFPDAELAAEAHARLMQQMPEAGWTIVDESAAFDD